MLFKLIYYINCIIFQVFLSIIKLHYLYLFNFNLMSYNHHFNLIVFKSFHMLNFYIQDLNYRQVYDLDNIFVLYF